MSSVEQGEAAYLAALREILDKGDFRPCRNVKDGKPVNTWSLFGQRFVYDLSDGKLPLFTTKRVFWKGVKEELLWFLQGDTYAPHLSEKGVRIWDGNGSREFLDSRSLTYKEGELGPVYGFQWRHWGAAYEGHDVDYDGKGIDQVQRVIDGLKTDPYGRRHIISAWNVGDLDKMALPPCHMFCQFHVTSKGELSCQLYQRSADMGLGVPFNVASYSLLTHMIGKVTGYKPTTFIHILGDAHIYESHKEPLELQMEREILPSPTLSIEGDAKEIDDIKSEDIVLTDYKAGKSIPMEFIV